MSLAVLAPLKSRPAVPPVGVPPAKVGGYVAVTVSVRADRQRLFQLLTVAEYMEAWLTAPGAERDGRLSITSDLESFRIDHFHARGIDFSITGLYRACRRSKLQFTWRKDTEGGSSTSLVLVRMYGDFERTNVSLIHSYIDSPAERLWHRELWETSLNRLCLLF